MLRTSIINKPRIQEAADIIKSGGLVAFPTETVYGLGADAFNVQAVARIYEAKGRPGDNPLILHVANIAQFLQLSEAVPDYALALAQKFWPGPLTLVTPKSPILPSWVGGHPSRNAATIGVRIPNHSIALALIEAVGGAVSAPSANKAGRPSPTTAWHVKADFGDEIEMILDGDISHIGLESTVVDVTGDAPVILRPGAITKAMIYETANISPGKVSQNDNAAPRSPGMKYRHYAPKAPITIVSGTSDDVSSYILQQSAKNAAVLVTDTTSQNFKKIHDGMKILPLGNNHESIAQNLFARLRQCDEMGVDIIFAEAVQSVGIGVAIMDRLLKAAEGNIVYV